jgi:hypothetical protein
MIMQTTMNCKGSDATPLLRYLLTGNLSILLITVLSILVIEWILQVLDSLITHRLGVILATFVSICPFHFISTLTTQLQLIAPIVKTIFFAMSALVVLEHILAFELSATSWPIAATGPDVHMVQLMAR